MAATCSYLEDDSRPIALTWRVERERITAIHQLVFSVSATSYSHTANGTIASEMVA